MKVAQIMLLFVYIERIEIKKKVVFYSLNDMLTQNQNYFALKTQWRLFLCICLPK